MLELPSFLKYQHIFNNRSFKCFGLKSSTKKRLTWSQRMIANTWYTYQTTTTNISLWSAKGCQWAKNLATNCASAVGSWGEPGRIWGNLGRAKTICKQASLTLSTQNRMLDNFSKKKACYFCCMDKNYRV